MTGAVYLLVGVVWLLVVIGAAGVCVAKGKPWLAAAGVLLSPVWSCVGAIRLAAPRSHWARRYYDSDKLLRSQVRFTKVTADVDPLPNEQDSEPWADQDPAEMDRITRRAMRRQRRTIG